MKTLLFLLLPLSVFAQIETSVYGHLGGRGTNINATTFTEGPDIGLGIEAHPVTNEYSGPTWYAHARVTYNSVWVTGFGKYRAAHFKGGLGLTDGKHIFSAINVGYLFGIDQRAGASATLDVSLRLKFLAASRFTPYLETYAGTTMTTVFPTEQRSTAYIGGAVGLTYRL